MTKTIGEASQLLLDLYNQDYGTANDFIGIEHAAMLFSSEYNRQIREEYNRMKMLAKAETGYSFAAIDPSWMVREEVEVKKDGKYGIAELSQKVFSFDYDVLGYGVQVIAPTEGDCGQIVRVSIHDKWTYRTLPHTDKVFAYVQQTSATKDGKATLSTAIKFLGSKLPKCVEIFYIPGPSEINMETSVSEGRVKPVIDSVLQTMLIARSQTVIDKSTDSNNNRVMLTEINPDSKK